MDISVEIAELRAQMANSPENEFVRIRLATALHLVGSYHECLLISSQVCCDGSAAVVLSDTVSGEQASRAMYEALRRARHVFEDEARQSPGPDSFRLTMDAYEMGLRMFESELGIDPDVN